MRMQQFWLPAGQTSTPPVTDPNADAPLPPIPDALPAAVGVIGGMLNGLFIGAAVTAVVIAARGRKRRRK